MFTFRTLMGRAWLGLCLVLATAVVAGDVAAGFTVASADPLLPIRDDRLDLSRSGAALEPIRLVAPRAGVASGQVVVADTKPLAGLTATVGAFEGPGRIPDANVRVRFAAMKGEQERMVLRYEAWQKPGGYYCDLHDTPPAAAVIPVWVTVTAPADAAPGLYTATLTIAGPAAPVAVPIQLTVAPWTVPAPSTWVTHVGIQQSPDATALHYGVPYGSDEHFRLIEASYRYLGPLGCDLAWIPAINTNARGVFHRSMVTYTKRDGRLVPDLTLVERYLDIHQRYCGQPEVMYVWLFTRDKSATPTFTVPDADGTTVHTVPQLGPEAEALYTDLLAGLRASLARRGWPERALVLGACCESRPSPEVVEMFARIAPGMTWMNHQHDPSKSFEDVEVSYIGFARTNPVVWQDLPWKNPRLVVSTHYKSPSTFGHPAYWRWRAEHYMYGANCRGFSRIGADFWTYRTADGQVRRVDHYSGGQPTIMLSESLPCLLAPGPHGAIATVQYEMMREGLQELEARIAIERALDEQTAPDGIEERWRGKPLIRKPDGTVVKRDTSGVRSGRLKGGQRGLDWEPFAAWDWQDRTRALYDLAADCTPAGK